jgi:UDPglucose 6-dehydrogenase
MRDPAKIAIVGSGVVGTATGSGFASKGHQVTFCDADHSRMALLRAEGLRVVDVDGLGTEFFDAYLISVPTPTVGGRIDISFVRAASRAVGGAIADHPARPLVVVRSTVLPGTTDGLVIPEIERSSGRMAGRGFSVCMNPEFLRAVSAADDFLRPRVIVIGELDGVSGEALARIYAPWKDVPVRRMSIVSAEATKYAANNFNAAKISFFNEMDRLLSSLGADTSAAFTAASLGAEGLWNPTYGTSPGRPFGGVCLPKDLAAIIGLAEVLGREDEVPLLRAVAQVNESLAVLVESDPA